MMHSLIILLITLLYVKITTAILIQQQNQQFPNPRFDYIYNKPTLTEFKPTFSSYQTLPSHPLSFYPPPASSAVISTIQSSNQFHTGHIPKSIRLDIPPAVLRNFFSNSDKLYYSGNGRLLRQYEVMERIIGDIEQPHDHILGPSPLLLNSFVSKFVAQNPNLAGEVLHPVTSKHGQIALGSGSLGYIQLGNGDAQLGSGSLGYISGQQASQAIVAARTRKALLPPGPLHFGHSFGN